MTYDTCKAIFDMGEVANDKVVVYSLTINGSCYIGGTTSFYKRMSEHRSALRHKKHFCIPLQEAVDSDSIESVKVSILEKDIPLDELLEREDYWIKERKPEFNSLEGATRKGVRNSEEARRKISEALTGRERSEEFKQNLSKTLQGNTRAVGNTSRRKVTPEIYNKVLDLKEKEGLGCRRIAKAVGLSKKTILNIFNGKYDYGYTRRGSD